MTEIIKDGYLSVKEDGLRAWIWSKRFCVLRDQALTFHRNEVGCCCRTRYLYMQTDSRDLLAIWAMRCFDFSQGNHISNKNRSKALLLRSSYKG